MIIALETRDPAARELEALAAQLRHLRRGGRSREPAGFARAINLKEIRHGQGCATYTIASGDASAEAAIETYDHIRNHYPGILDIMRRAMGRNAMGITIEVGTLNGNTAPPRSGHEMIRITPRILALFRGTIA